MDIIIAGYGIVGKELYNFFSEQADIYDPEKGHKLQNKKYKYAFISVPTDNDENGLCDISKVEDCIRLINADIFIIKSTVYIEATDFLAEKYKKNIIFSPEYFGNTKNNVPFNKNFVILGGDVTLTNKVAQLYMRHTPSNFIIRSTTSKTAELVKYMENSFIANKVLFSNQFYRISQLFNLDFNEVRSLFTLDERISPHFTYVFDDQPYYDSHCLNKDIPALIAHLEKNHNFRAELLQEIVRINEKYKDDS